ncbi:hypothetical protein BDZ88DRAFT_426565 [Geranomyces variabilis]|nr:hypothetical protein BDZ88DRAFT_426565 [Geranomyces variabilis]KAJ3141511.1 hypothetical protein HDU90_005850 [Geranomyces variabilis]
MHAANALPGAGPVPPTPPPLVAPPLSSDSPTAHPPPPPPPAHYSPRRPVSSSYLHAVFEGLEHEELAQGAPPSPPSDLEQQRQQDDLDQKAFLVFRTRLRKTYMVPFVTWLPSFGLILYYAFKSGFTAIYKYGAVAVWVSVLVATFVAYRLKYHRLHKVKKLGVLAHLSDEEVWNYIMHSGELRPAPAYDLRDEPLPLYACADDNVRGVAVARSNSLRPAAPSVETLEMMMRRPAADDFREEERRTVHVATDSVGGRPPGCPPEYVDVPDLAITTTTAYAKGSPARQSFATPPVAPAALA